MSVPARAADAPRTLRVDYFHTGSASEERFSVDRLVLEPLPWPGNPARPLDDTNLGKYLFEVIDRVVEPRPLLARLRLHLRRVGDDRRSEDGDAHLRRVAAVPAAGRAGAGRREEARSARMRSGRCGPPCVDPADIFIDRSASADARARSSRCSQSGDPASKVDLLILGDGYTAAERPKFEKDARRLVDILFATSPFKERKAGLQRLGALPAGGRVRDLAPSTGV